MPIFEIAGQDQVSLHARTIQVSARDEVDAARAAMAQGITEIKLRPMSDREILMMEEKCFLNGDPAASRALPKAASSIGAGRTTEQRADRQSLLLDRPFTVITGSVFLALMLDRLVGFLITQM